MMKNNLWRGPKIAGAAAALAVAGTMAATALPALAATDTPAAQAAVSVQPNPELPQKCGLNLAMVFDMSSSMSDSDVRTVKDASIAAVSALQGTATTMGVYSFATFAKQELAATSLVSAQGAAGVSGSIDSLVRPGDARSWSGGTNWQQGLGVVPTQNYDGVIFFTDGVPTFYGSNPLNTAGTASNGTGGTGQDGSANVAASLAAAVPEANRLKDAGTRVMAVGVNGADAGRLSQISGPSAGADYFTTNYAELAQTLKDIATTGCTGSLNINKAVEAFGSTETTPGEGWTFDVAPAGAEATALTTGANGQAGMTMAFPEKAPVRVSITERQLPGYSVVQKDGFNAVCTRDGNPLQLSNTSAEGNTGFEVTAEAGTITSCTVTNKAPQAPLTSWTMAKTSDRSGEVSPGDTINYTVEARNTGNQAVGDVTFRDDLSGVLDHAAFVPGSATLVVGGGASVPVADPDGAILTAGPFSLPVGATARLSYQVKVNQDAHGATLNNAVTGTGQVPPAECVVDKPCTTVNVVPPKPTPTPTPSDTATPTPTGTPSATGVPTTAATPTNPASVPASNTPAPTTESAGELAYTGSSAVLPLVVGGLLMAGGVLALMLRRASRTH